MAREDKLKALDAAISQIEKQYGKGSIMKLGDNSAHMNVETIPTGSLSLDIALGLGGLPKGRIIEIYGPESSGKTTVALHAVAEVQKRGGIAGFIDAEHALDPAYAKNIGVNIDELYISQPDCGEQALEITETMVRSGAVDIVIVDSVAALVPKAEIDGDMGDSHVGLQARLMSQALRKLTAVISKSNCIVIFINQLREKVGVMFGNPETTTGGRALKFYSSVRMDVRRIESLKQAGESAVGVLNVIITVFLANTVDYGEFKNSRRDESVIFSMQTFVVKLASGIAGFISSMVLFVFHISSNKEAVVTEPIAASSRMGLRLSMTIIPIVVLVIGFIVFKKRYILTDRKLAEISKELEKKHQN